MTKIKKGDVVVRKSYGKDIIFYVKRIIKHPKEKIAILCGISERIEADSTIDDLEILDKKNLHESLERNDRIIKEIINKKEKLKTESTKTDEREIKQKITTGKILHLDGDRRYSQKSYYYYKKMGLNAIVKSIPEYKQPKEVYRLLQIYKPDILIITGHDRNDKKGNEL